MKEPIDRELLVAYIQDRCTAEESVLVKKFLLQPEWQQALDDLLEEDFRHFAPGTPPEGLSETWNKHFHDKNMAAPVRLLWRKSWLGYAAACLILFSVGFYFLRERENLVKEQAATALLEKSNPRGQRSIITLPDSSVVYLGAESRIRFPEQFGTGNREVYLTGAAFFEVTKDKKHPFVIHTGNIQTKVLGTSFKVDAYAGKRVTISVATGKVRVDQISGNGKAIRSLAVITPGQEVQWNPKSGKAVIGEADIEGLRGWKEGNLSFVSAPLTSVAEQLERSYNVHIAFKDNSISNYHVSLLIKGTDPVTHALEIICNTTHLRFKTNGDHYIISKTGGQ